MTRIAVVGEPPRVDGWALAGALVVPAVGADAVRQAWDGLPEDVQIVIVTASAGAALDRRRTSRLVVVLP